MADPGLDAVVRKVDAALAVSAPAGLLRLGSTARGETAPRGRDGTSPSDIEYLHVAVSDPAKGSMRPRVADASTVASDSFSGVHVTSITARRLRRLRRTFWLWEAAASGCMVSGHDFRPLLPVVTTKNLDYEELNEVLLWRMYRLVESAVDGSGTGDVQIEIALRQALDIPTWWLPHRGVLRVGFSERVRLFSQSGTPRFVQHVVAAALAARTDPRRRQQPLADRSLVARALLWADDTRITLPRRHFSDVSPRALASRFAFLARRGNLSVPAAATTIRSRQALHARLRPLVEELATGYNPAPARSSTRWATSAREVISWAKQSVEWLVEEGDVT